MCTRYFQHSGGIRTVQWLCKHASESGAQTCVEQCRAFPISMPLPLYNSAEACWRSFDLYNLLVQGASRNVCTPCRWNSSQEEKDLKDLHNTCVCFWENMYLWGTWGTCPAMSFTGQGVFRGIMEASCDEIQPLRLACGCSRAAKNPSVFDADVLRSHSGPYLIGKRADRRNPPCKLHESMSKMRSSKIGAEVLRLGIGLKLGHVQGWIGFFFMAFPSCCSLMLFLGPKWAFGATLQSDLILAHPSATICNIYYDTLSKIRRFLTHTVAALCQTDKSMGVRHMCVHNVTPKHDLWKYWQHNLAASLWRSMMSHNQSWCTDALIRYLFVFGVSRAFLGVKFHWYTIL